MSSMTPIYEATQAPVVGRGDKWAKLFVHKNVTEEDREALVLFERLAESLSHESPSRKAVLSIVRLDEQEVFAFGELPCIANGALWRGLEEVRNFVDLQEMHARTPLFV